MMDDNEFNPYAGTISSPDDSGLRGSSNPVMESVIFEDIIKHHEADFVESRPQVEVLSSPFAESARVPEPRDRDSKPVLVKTPVVDSPEVHKPQIDISVHDPEKFGDGMNAYVVYKVKTLTSLPQFHRGEFGVTRRYNDFVWFHDQLREHNKGVLIPPLPEKGIMSRFSAEFIESRRRDLEKFLNRVANHATLHRRAEFITFLSAADDQFAAAKSAGSSAPKPKKREDTENASPQPAGGSIGSSIVSFFGSGLSAVSSSLNAAVSTKASDPDQWFDSKKGYINTLETHLTALAKNTSQLARRRKDLAQAHTEFASSASLVGSCEADLDSFISTSFIRIAQIEDQMFKLNDDLSGLEVNNFEEAQKDYIRILGSVKDMLGDRDEVLLEYQNATRALDAKKDKLERTKSAPSKLRAAEKEVEEATVRVEDTKKEYERISAMCKRELEIFDATRAKEIRRMIMTMVQSNMEHSLQVADLWKVFMSDMHNSEEGLDTTKNQPDKVSWGHAGASNSNTPL